MNNPKLRNFIDGRSLFSEIETVKTFPFMSDGVDVLDTMLDIYHGSKTMFVPMVDCELSIIARMIVARHGKNWDDLIKRELVAENVNRKRIISETITDNQSRTNQSENLETVSAYNTDEMVNSGGGSSSGGDTLEGEKVKTSTDEIIDVKAAYHMLSTSSKDSIVKTVLENVSGFLTLSIY